VAGIGDFPYTARNRQWPDPSCRRADDAALGRRMNSYRELDAGSNRVAYAFIALGSRARIV
jgi:hypothetical protein